MNNIFHLGLNIIPSSREIFRSFIIANGIYGFWILAHFISAHLYTEFCTPKTFIGFISSPLLASSPHCNGLRWMINEGANSINAMWIILGTWFIGSFATSNNNNTKKQVIVNCNHNLHKPP